ncbi:glycosyltransferase family 9 protein [Dinghuibacter silviterrae]|uniref:glycosyltransferase family 9 protein n=1 Tax=Dinghuibacter silviterrae TaxID=1539049 RepID=UPI0013C2E987|nr:glycosyltransferase family 9 protein [Dinghuibacter silviterrae]
MRKRALGDVLWTEPVIRALAARHRRLTVVTKFNDLFLNYPLSNVRFRSSLPFWRKILVRLGIRWRTVVLDDAYEQSPHRHFLEAYQAKAGLPLVREYPRLYLSASEKALHPPKPYVVLHLESFTDKNYRKVYGIDWNQVSAYLAGEGYAVYQLGKNPAPIEGVAHKETTLREMMALLHNAALFIGLDSGPSHIAAALGVPSIVFFGAVNPLYRHFPELWKGLILQGACPYAGCFHEAPDPETMVCRLVGNEGIPVCSLHTTEGVLDAIVTLRQKYIC